MHSQPVPVGLQRCIEFSSANIKWKQFEPISPITASYKQEVIQFRKPARLLKAKVKLLEIWQQRLFHLSASFLPGRHSSWPFFKVTKTESSLIWLMEHVGCNTQRGWKHWGYFINSFPRTCTKPRQQPICPLWLDNFAKYEKGLRVSDSLCSPLVIIYHFHNFTTNSTRMLPNNAQLHVASHCTILPDIKPSRKPILADMSLTQTSTDTLERYSVVSFYKGLYS